MFGIVEEVTFNITNLGEANAAMIPDDIPTVDPALIQTTSVAAASVGISPYVQKKHSKLFQLLHLII